MVDEERGKKRSFIHKRSNESELRQSSATGRMPGGRFDDLPKDRDDTDEAGIKVGALSGEPMTLEQMAHYLNCLAKESGNRFKVSNTPSELRLKRNGDGSPVDINTGDGGAEDVFDPGQSGQLDTVHGATNHFINESIDDLVKPGQSGHDLLSDIVPTQPSPKSPSFDTSGQNQISDPAIPSDGIQKKISAVLNNNRFNAGGATPFVPRGTATSNVDQRPIGRSQTQLGVYDSGPANITYEDMKKLGLSLMLRATGEFVQGDPTDAGVTAAALIPGEAQLAATRLNRKSMWAGDLTTDQGAPDRKSVV